MKKTSNNTIVKKGLNGWEAKTIENYGGYDWEISTEKNNSGKIVSIARAGKAGESNGFMTFLTSPLTSPNLKLVSIEANATEKTIKKVHTKGLLQFDCLKEAEQLPINPKGEHKGAYKIKVGQIIFLNGYGQSLNSHEKKAIYSIDCNEWGTISYKYVNLKTLELGSTEHLIPSTEIFGIGMYYIKNQRFDINTLNNILIEAKEKEQKKQKTEEASKLLNKQLISAKIEEGKKGLLIPKDAKAVIVAELMEDQSDSQTDYFHSASIKTIYLAYSKHKRDLFNEMRKACLNCDIEEIRQFAITPVENKRGEEKTEENAEFWTPKDEHREKYSMGAGYYLQSGYTRSGWRISKEKHIDLQSETWQNQLAIANAEGLYFCQTKEVKQNHEQKKNSKN